MPAARALLAALCLATATAAQPVADPELHESRELEIERFLASGGHHAAATVGAPSAAGANPFRMNGEIRIRGEIRDRLYSDDPPNGDESYDVVRLRTRVGFVTDVLENLGVTVEFQDIRAWGEESSTTGQLDNVDLKKGFLDVRDLGGRPIDVQAGRMVIQYGGQRLVGNLEWLDQGRSYDGVRVQVHPETWAVDVFAYKVRETFAADDDQNFFGVYGGPRWLDAYALVLQDQLSQTGETGAADNSLFVTLGARLHGSTGPWSYVVEVPVQWGEWRGDDLVAWAFSAEGGYTFEGAAWRPRVYAEFNWASGDDDPSDGDVGQFQTLFPTNHLYYGFADQVGWSNLVNIRVGVVFEPAEAWKVRLDYHHFRRPEEEGAWVDAAGAVVRPGAPGTSRHLGDEIDIVVAWIARDPLVLEFGWAVFVPGGFVEETGPSPTSQFAYLQCRVLF